MPLHHKIAPQVITKLDFYLIKEMKALTGKMPLCLLPANEHWGEDFHLYLAFPSWSDEAKY